MFFLTLLFTAQAATVKQSDGTSLTYETVQGFNNHRMETYFKYGIDGRPTAFGLKFATELDTMFDPTETGHPVEWPSFPSSARCSSTMPWNHVQLNYNPNGHPGGWSQADEQAALANMANDPTSVDTLIGTKSTWFQRHLDIHFSVVTPAESQAINCSGGYPPCQPNAQEAQEFASYNPKTVPRKFYNSPIAWVKGMGAHLPESSGQSWQLFHDEFSFIYGTYNNKIQYWEAMVTMTALESLPTSSAAGRRLQKYFKIPLAKEVDQTGYYPSSIQFTKDTFIGHTDDCYTIEFQGLKFRNAPGDSTLAACPVDAMQGCSDIATTYSQLGLSTQQMAKHCKAAGCKMSKKTGKCQSRKKVKKCKKHKSSSACTASSRGCIWNPLSKKKCQDP